MHFPLHIASESKKSAHPHLANYYMESPWPAESGRESDTILQKKVK